MIDGVLTQEEYEILPEEAQQAFVGITDAVWRWQFTELILYLCYELAQAKLEVRRLREAANDRT